MGLNVNAIMFLLAAHRRGTQFGRCLTVGRLDLTLYSCTLRKMLEDVGVFDDTAYSRVSDEGERRFAEPFFEMLGAETVDSLDISDFEGATVCHNLNEPIPDELRERYDVICDGGTLEHIYNFPAALKNCMDMLSVGGSLFIHAPLNNCCGHGFYQFSPDLFFRALGSEYGFEVNRMVVHPIGPYGRWHEVSDPQDVGDRVELITWRPMNVLVHAIKREPTPPGDLFPQQTTYESEDYSKMKSKADTAGRQRAKAWWIAKFPVIAQFFRVVRNGFAFYTQHSLFNRKCYTPVRKWPPQDV